jgi:hypothetical protein
MQTLDPRSGCSKNAAVVERACALINASPYFCNRTRNFEFELADNVLVVRGRVPSFHLKQLLQSLLGKLDGVERVDTRIHAISAEGLSSSA